jgi:hypothetical protein
MEKVDTDADNFIMTKQYKILKSNVLEKIVGDFVTLFFKENIHTMIREWGRYPIFQNAGEVENLKYMIETILYTSFDFSIHPRHIEIFKDLPIFRIQLDMIDSVTIVAIDKMKYRHSHFFNTEGIEATIPVTYHYKHFVFNHIFEKNVDRCDIVINLLYKLLMVSIEMDQTLNMFTVMRRFLHSVIDTIAISRYQSWIVANEKNKTTVDYMKGTEKKPTEPLYMTFLLGTSQYLKDPILLKEKLSPFQNVYFHMFKDKK